MDKNTRLLNGRYRLRTVLGTGGFSTIYLAIDETNRVIGSVGIQIRDHTARLHRLFILPSLKRRGIGSALLETAEAFARKKEAGEVIVHLGDPQYYWESACFYPHHGYTEFAPRWTRKELK